MEDKDLQELEQALRAATPEPWEAVLPGDPRGQPVCYYRGLIALVERGDRTLAVVLGDGHRYDTVPHDQWEANATAIAAIRNAAPSLISEIREARRLLGEARGALRAVLCGTPVSELPAISRVRDAIAGIDREIGP